MKKAIALILALVLCLSLCACGSSEPIINPYHEETFPEATENEETIKFDPPVVVAEDEYVRVELIEFYQEHYIWHNIGGMYGTPEKVTPGTDGASLEKLVVFKIYNKTDHRLEVYMDDIYLGNEGATEYLMHTRISLGAGKNVTAPYVVRTGELEALQSMEELYFFEGRFTIAHEYEDGRNRTYGKLSFSIPAALDMN